MRKHRDKMDDELRPEYDLRQLLKLGVRGKYAKRYHAARRSGKKRVCGWEPNGGFLTGSDITRDGSVLPALLTRDAILPILGVLFAADESGVSVVDLFRSEE